MRTDGEARLLFQVRVPLFFGLPKSPRVGCAVFFRLNPHGHVEQIRTPFSERVVVPLVKHQYDIMEHRLVLLDLDLFPVCSRQDLDYVGPKVRTKKS